MTAAKRTEQSEALHRRATALCTIPTAAQRHAYDAEVDQLALDIARFQREHIGPHAQLWESRGIEPAAVDSIDRIPALPCDVFRLRRVAVHPAEQDERCFRTSGTSRGEERRGSHGMRTTRTYARAALCFAQHMLWPDTNELGFIGLLAPETDVLDSSLGFMLARFAEQLDPTASWHVHHGALDVDGVARACAEARGRERPALVAGTSLAFAELVAELDPTSLALPAASRVMHTGGFKGRTDVVDATELRAAIAALFHVPPSHVVGEYGMTELSSQLYEGSLRRALGLGCSSALPGCYFPPPWMRVRAIHPETLAPVALGEIGLGELLDVANVDSALRVLTGDLVRLRPDGSVQLLGRAPGAPARGCSLAAGRELRGEPSQKAR